MKKTILLLALAAAMTACTNDDRYSWDDDFADLTATDTIDIALNWSGQTVTVSGDDNGYVSVSGADVTVRSATNKFLNLSLSGTSTDGSLTIFSWRKLGLTLAGLQLTNTDGPAINNQCGKSLVVMLAAGTQNTLTDGTDYTPVVVGSDTLDQKGTLFSEGQIYLRGKGALTVNANARNGIASDDFIVVEDGTLNVNVSTTGTNGIKVNDGFTVSGGTLNIAVTAPGARGINSDARTTVSGGTTTITTSGDCKIETVGGVQDTTSCAGIKSDSLFTMTAGTLVITSSGDGGKGINCSEDVVVSGGTLDITTTGSNDVGKPKGVKSDTAIIVSGGSFTVNVSKSWACDNGTDSDDPADRVTIVGTPATTKLLKKSVVIQY